MRRARDSARSVVRCFADERDATISSLYLALGAMTVQQSLATMGRSTVPLIAAAIVADLAIDPALVGV